MSHPTLHDQVIALLEQTLSTVEDGEIHLPMIAPLARPLIERVRREQHYDPEVQELLDRFEALLAKGKA